MCSYVCEWKCECVYVGQKTQVKMMAGSCIFSMCARMYVCQCWCVQNYAMRNFAILVMSISINFL